MYVTLSSCLFWQIISFVLSLYEYGCVYAWTTLGNITADRLTEDDDFVKKITSSVEAHFDLGGYVNKQNCRIWGTENQHAYLKKPTHSKRVTLLFGFWSKGIIGDHYRIMLNEFLFRNLGFKRTALRATQPKLYSMFCSLFLKITLSVAELMVFGHIEAAIWHSWTIICGVPPKISVTPTSWSTAAHNR